MPVAEATRSAIERVVRERLAPAPVERVDVDEYSDSGGEPALQVRVVYVERDGGLDIGRASGLIRHILVCLAELGDLRFPMVSFVSLQDDREVQAEAR